MFEDLTTVKVTLFEENRLLRLHENVLSIYVVLPHTRPVKASKIHKDISRLECVSGISLVGCPDTILTFRSIASSS